MVASPRQIKEITRKRALKWIKMLQNALKLPIRTGKTASKCPQSQENTQNSGKIIQNPGKSKNTREVKANQGKSGGKDKQNHLSEAGNPVISAIRKQQNPSKSSIRGPESRNPAYRSSQASGVISGSRSNKILQNHENPGKSTLSQYSSRKAIRSVISAFRSSKSRNREGKSSQNHENPLKIDSKPFKIKEIIGKSRKSGRLRGSYPGSARKIDSQPVHIQEILRNHRKIKEIIGKSTQNHSKSRKSQEIKEIESSQGSYPGSARKIISKS